MKRKKEYTPLRIQANGLGQQSAALYFMSSLGIIDRFDYSIFADPGAEKPKTYEYLEYMTEWAKANNGVPLIVVQKKNIERDLLNGRNSTKNTFASIPAFTKTRGKQGMLRRQCTSEYKIEQVNAAIKKLYGLGGKQRYPKTYLYMGITLDEFERCSSNEIKELINVYPFCDIQASVNYGLSRPGYRKIWGDLLGNPETLMTRANCTKWLRENGFLIPPKSSCYFCPYQSNADWKEMKLNEQEIWLKAVKLDKKIRNSSKMGVNSPIYLHRSLKPLNEVDLQENQIDMFNCDSGYCGI